MGMEKNNPIHRSAMAGHAAWFLALTAAARSACPIYELGPLKRLTAESSLALLPVYFESGVLIQSAV